MNIIFFCQSASVDDPVVGDTLQRIESMALHPEVESIDVIALRGESRQLSTNIQIHSLHRDRYGKLRTLLYLYYLAGIKILAKKKVKFIYIYMSPTTAIAFFPLKLIYRFKTVTWFAHTVFRPLTRLALRYFSDLWVSVDKAQVLTHYPNYKIIGQGVNVCDLYPTTETKKKFDVVTLGRVTPAKKLELILDVLAKCKHQYGKEYSFVIGGTPYLESDKSYVQELKSKVQELGLDSQVHWHGKVKRQELRSFLNTAKVFFFSTPGGIGKAPLESMACGLRVVLTEKDSKAFFPRSLANQIVFNNDIEELAQVLIQYVEEDEKSRNLWSENIHSFISQHHNMKDFGSKVVNEVSQIL